MMEEDPQTTQAKKDLKQAALLDSLIHPFVLGPATLGSTALAAAFAIASDNPLLWFGGIAGLLVGAGFAGWRLFRRYPKLIADSLQQFDQEQTSKRTQSEEEQLNNLAERLQADGNPLTEQLLADLRHCSQRHKILSDVAKDDPLSDSINHDLEQLIAASLHALHHLADLSDSIKPLKVAKSIEGIIAERAQIITELQENLSVITKQIQDLDLQATTQQQHNDLSKATSAEDLARLRSQLSANIAVAERVEERLKELDHEIEQPTKP